MEGGHADIGQKISPCVDVRSFFFNMLSLCSVFRWCAYLMFKVIKKWVTVFSYYGLQDQLKVLMHKVHRCYK